MRLLRTRRQALAGVLSSVPVLATLQVAARAQAHRDAEARLAELEHANGGLLGVAIQNLATGTRAAHRADERFLMCSTFKTLLAAFVLSRVDQEEEKRDRHIAFSRENLVVWSPVTETRLGDAGMTVTEICDATVTLSDNTAANLLLAGHGGPAALTAFIRGLGDEVTLASSTSLTKAHIASAPFASTAPSSVSRASI